MKKVCVTCKIEKPIENFGNHRYDKNGYRST